MPDSLRLPIPGRLTAQFVVVDPRNAADPPAVVEAHGEDDPRGIEIRVRRIGADHDVLPAPALLAGGGARPQILSRVYEAASEHLLVTAELQGTAGPAGQVGQVGQVGPLGGIGGAGRTAPGVEPMADHVHRACAVAARLARETGGLLLDPALARLLDLAAPGANDPGDANGLGDPAPATAPVPDLLRIGAVGEHQRLTMTTMGLTRLGLPELRTLDLAPFLGPAWARLLHGAAWRLLLRPPRRPDPVAPSSHWLLPRELTVSEVQEGSGAPATLGLRQDPAGGPRPALLVVAPQGWTGAEDDWRMDVVNQVFPAARV